MGDACCKTSRRADGKSALMPHDGAEMQDGRFVILYIIGRVLTLRSRYGKENDLGLGMHCLALKLNIIKSTNYLFTNCLIQILISQ